MKDVQGVNTGFSHLDAHAKSVNALAMRALSVLSEQVNSNRHFGQEIDYKSICAAFIHSDPDTCYKALCGLEAQDVPYSDIVDHIIPNVARLMEEHWLSDTLSFTDVTIGVARLQEVLHRLDFEPPRVDLNTAPRVLLILPKPELHSLGMFVATHQLRRYGVRVKTAMGELPRKIAKDLQVHTYDMIGITCSGPRSISATLELVQAIRRGARTFVPIVVGGACVGQSHNIKQLTGCDHVCGSALKALEVCGLDQKMKMALRHN